MNSSEKRRALFALILLAPAPTLGIASALIWFPGPIGQAIFGAAKVWILALPVAWYLAVDRGRPSWSPPTRGGLGVGLGVGIGMGLAIVLAYIFLGMGSIDPAAIREEAADMGIDSLRPFLLGAAYWTLVNSLIEEYVYRWFVFSKAEVLVRRPLAILLSAVVFTLHHVVAVGTYLTPTWTILASVGVFVAGVVWAAMYASYRSIWPGWLAHIVADVAVFACGWHLLFG